MSKRKAKRDPSPDRSRSRSGSPEPVPTTSRGAGSVVDPPRPGGVGRGRGRRRLPPTVVAPGRQLAQQSLMQFVVQQRDPDGSRRAETDEESLLDEEEDGQEDESPAVTVESPAVTVGESSTGSRSSRRPLRTAAAAVPTMAESPVGSEDQSSSDEDFVPYRPSKEQHHRRQAGKTFVLYFFPHQYYVYVLQ